MKAHFEDKEVGDTDAWAGQMDNVAFHVYAMKEPDYIMSLMSSYGTNNHEEGRETTRQWKQNGELVIKKFKYPDVVNIHFLFRHSVDDHNTKRHSPISLEVVWATKRWPNRVFAFLLGITEVNCFLAEKQFTSRKSESMMDFRKLLAYELIENNFIVQEQSKKLWHSS